MPQRRSSSSAAAVLLLLLLGAAAHAAAPPPPIQIDGWSSSSDVAKGLASKLVDGSKFTITGATYKGDNKAAGFATLRDCGRYTSRDKSGKAPGHFLAPWFRDGAVCLSTAKIVGTSWPDPLKLTARAPAPEIPRSVRSTRLTLSLRALATGHLRVPWTYQDASYTFWNYQGDHEPQTNSTFRIAINGVQRGVIGSNRWMSVHNCQFGLIDRTFGPDPDAGISFIYHADADMLEVVDPIEPIEFQGLAYQYQTTRALIKKGDKVKVDVVIADVPELGKADTGAPSILYFPPKAVTLSSVHECKKDSDCGSGKSCCGGICCTKSVQCCSGKECCSNPASTCIAPNALTPAACCHGAASCVVGGKATCCPPGTRCVKRKCVD